MKKEIRLTSPRQFSAVFRRGSSRSNSLLVMRALPNGLAESRYGFSVSKKVGNAVTRNRLKRQLREICRLSAVKQGYDIVFIVRPPAAGAIYSILKENAENLFSRDKLLLNAEGAKSAPKTQASSGQTPA